MRISLTWALLASLAAALLLSLVPAGVALDRRLAAELEDTVQRELLRAPMVLKDRNAGRSAALMMHAQEVAHAQGLADALTQGNRAVALTLLSPPDPSEEPVLVDERGEPWVGIDPGGTLVDATRAGEMPVDFVSDSGIHVVSIAPVQAQGIWRGAAGVSQPVDAITAGTLAGLTASDVVILESNGKVVASTAGDTLSEAVAGAADWTDGSVHEIATVAGEYWAVAAPLGQVGSVVFARNASRQLALLPRLRRNALLAGGIALALALLLGGLVATALARPVRGLATAADRLAQGDFHSKLRRSRITEVDRMAAAFRHMRRALAERLEELATANRELGDEQSRLRALQSELIRRDRLVASGRLVTELAHEIRNPVANVRNCLEVIHRGLRKGDTRLRRFADLAIDELLRMHELAEQMLDLNRPLDPASPTCDPREVVSRVVALLGAGAESVRWPVNVEMEHVPEVRIAPDTLKQILLTLVQNARDAMPEGGTTDIRARTEGGVFVLDVLDEGEGIPEDIMPRVFDPFFTTKGDVQGVGLGLFVAEGLVRRHGGRLVASNRDGKGAHFRVELPVVETEGQDRGGEVPATAEGKGEQ
jgi:signal transduction histidine kinase